MCEILIGSGEKNQAGKEDLGYARDRGAILHRWSGKASLKKVMLERDRREGALLVFEGKREQV